MANFIHEATITYKFFKDNNSGIINIHQGNSPKFVFVPFDSKFYLISVKPTKLNKLYQSVIFKSDVDSENIKNLYFFIRRGIGNFDKFLSDIKSRNDIFNIEIFDNLDDVAYWLYQNHNFSLLVLERLFKKSFDFNNKVTQKINGFEIIYNEIKENKKDSLKRVLEKVSKTLQTYNLESLGNIKIQVTPIKGQYWAYYLVNDDSIKIDPTFRDENNLFHTVLHELGHRFENKASKEIIKEIALEYFKHRNKNVENSNELTMLEKIKQIEPGDILEYTGKKKDLKANNPFVVSKVSTEKIQMTGKNNISFGGSISSFFNDNFIHTSKNNKQSLGLLLSHNLYSANSNSFGWVPTPYSRMNNSEWWAELFAFYLSNKLKDDPKQWVEKIISKF